MDLTARFLNHPTPVVQAPEQAEPTDPAAPDRRGPIKRGPVSKQRRLDEAQLLKLVAEYIAGSTVEGLARKYGVNASTIHQQLKRRGVQRHPYRRITDAQLPQAIQLYENGMSLRALAKHLGVAPKTVRTRLLEAGVTIRPS